MSVGIQASAVGQINPPSVPLKIEDFDDMSEWSPVGTLAVVTGRTGVARGMTGIASYTLTLPVANQTTKINVGFWMMCSLMSAFRTILQTRTTGGTQNTLSIRVEPDGSINYRIGGQVGTVLFTTAAGVIKLNQWHWFELRANIDHVTGYATIRVDGIDVGSAVNVDNFSLGPINEACQITNSNGAAGRFDDLYVGSDGGYFIGPQRFGTGPNAVLDDGFNTTLGNWFLSGATLPAFAPGRNGQALGLASSSVAKFVIPAAFESYYVVVGFAMKVTQLPTGADANPMFRLSSDGGATTHVSLRVSSAGVLTAQLGTSSPLVASAAGAIVANTWQFVELAVLLHDTAGALTMRINGAVVGTPLTDSDIKNAGTKTTIDTVEIDGSFSFAGAQPSLLIDDLYVRTGTLSDFLGDHAIP